MARQLVRITWAALQLQPSIAAISFELQPPEKSETSERFQTDVDITAGHAMKIECIPWHTFALACEPLSSSSPSERRLADAGAAVCTICRTVACGWD